MTRPGPLAAALAALGLGLAPWDAAPAQERAQQQRAYQDCMILARAAPADGLESASPGPRWTAARALGTARRWR
jgi:hypothetical protein